MNGVGKTSLARRLGASLDYPVVHCDLFMQDGPLAFPANLDLGCLRRVICNALAHDRPVIIESVMLQLVLDALNLTPEFSIYVKHSWPDGVFTRADFFDAAKTEDDLIEPINEIARACQIDDDEPMLERQLIRYHKRQVPHENVHVLFELSFHGFILFDYRVSHDQPDWAKRNRPHPHTHPA
jgi:hypothetical protein